MPAADRHPRLAHAALALACATACVSGLPAPVRTPFALCLVLWLPGRALLGLALPGSVAGPEGRVLAVALSLALAVLAGLALNLAGALGRNGWALALAGMGVVATLATPRRPATPAAPAPLPEDRPGARTGLRRADLALAALGIALGLAAYAAARAGALAHDQYRYTEAWMVPATDGTTAVLGIRNAERAPAAYEVEVLDAGRTVGRWPGIGLEPGEVATFPLDATAGPVRRRLEARLFKDGRRDLVYRQVWIDVPARPAPAGRE